MKTRKGRTAPSYRRHDVSDAEWAILEPLLPGRKGQRGRAARNNRAFVNAVRWIARTGAPWRDLPPGYGKWNTAARRFRRWAKGGVWERVFRALARSPDLAWVAVDATHVKAHQHAAGARGGGEGIALTKGGATQNCTCSSRREASRWKSRRRRGPWRTAPARCR